MSSVDAADVPEGGEEKKKSSKILLFAGIGAVLVGGGLFAGIYLGAVPVPAILGGETQKAEAGESSDAGHDGSYKESVSKPGDRDFVLPGFVELEDLVISLGANARASHLLIALTIETDPDSVDTVTDVMPRVLDVLNTFLRAVDEREFEQPHAMTRLRAQMLRRVQLVTPPGTVKDILIRAFVLS